MTLTFAFDIEGDEIMNKSHNKKKQQVKYPHCLVYSLHIHIQLKCLLCPMKIPEPRSVVRSFRSEKKTETATHIKQIIRKNI